LERKELTLLTLRGVNNGALSGSQQRGNTGGVADSSADNLEGVKDTGGDHVDVLSLGGVVSHVEVVGVLVGQLSNDNGSLSTGVLNDGAGRFGDGGLDDVNTELLVEVGDLDVVKGVLGSLKESGSSSGQDTLLDGSAGGVKGVNETVLLLTDLNLGGSSDLDDGNTSGELGKTLLELLLLVLRGGGVSHGSTDLFAALSDHVLGSVTVEDDGVLLGDRNSSGGTEHVGGELVELGVNLIGEDLTSGEDSKISENVLAVVSESGGLDGNNLELTTELVKNTDGESLTLNVLSNDDQRTALLGRDLKSGDDVLDGGNLLLGEEDQGLLELSLGGLGVGDEVGRNESTVELHSLGNLELVLDGLTLLNGDNTLLSNLLHGVGDQLSDMAVSVGGDGGDLGNLSGGGDVTLVGLEVLNDGLDGGLGTTAEVHGVASGGDVLDGLGEDSAGKDGSGGGSISGNVVGLGGNVLEETGSEVLELVLEDNGLGNGNTVCRQL
jgi:hypothetical protein